MICLICRQAEIVDRLTSVNFQRDEMHLNINQVPARVCPRCGETYLNEEVTVRVLRCAEELFNAGLLEKVIKYENFV